jgi:hypothetical protein
MGIITALFSLYSSLKGKAKNLGHAELVSATPQAK